jgi:hypothetical protein
VRIENGGSASQRMAGWKLKDEANHTYAPSITLAPGGSVKSHSGPDASHNPPTDYRWTTAYIWNNDGDTAYLYNAGGSLVDDYHY